jgi:hypothetical protein
VGLSQNRFAKLTKPELLVELGKLEIDKSFLQNLLQKVMDSTETEKQDILKTMQKVMDSTETEKQDIRKTMQKVMDSSETEKQDILKTMQKVMDSSETEKQDIRKDFRKTVNLLEAENSKLKAESLKREAQVKSVYEVRPLIEDYCRKLFDPTFSYKKTNTALVQQLVSNMIVPGPTLPEMKFLPTTLKRFNELEAYQLKNQLRKVNKLGVIGVLVSLYNDLSGPFHRSDAGEIGFHVGSENMDLAIATALAVLEMQQQAKLKNLDPPPFFFDEPTNFTPICILKDGDVLDYVPVVGSGVE